MNKIIAKSKYLEFKSAKISNNADWYYVKRTNDTYNHDSAVVITTLIKKNKNYEFLFLYTARPPLLSENKSIFSLESPAGLIGDINSNESTIECAKKELLEETGLIASNIFIELKNSATSGGLTSETLTYVTAIVENENKIQKPIDDDGVIIKRFKLKADKIDDFLNKINQDKISIAAPTICGIFYALKRITHLETLLDSQF